MSAEDIVVVGAGPAGLAVSACLHREGLAHVVLEREQDVASTWRRHYDRLHLHTTKTYSALPMTPWPAQVPRYPSRAQVVQYLQAYAQQHRIAPRFGVTVNRIARKEGCLHMDTNTGVLTPRFVVMATGYNGSPRIPAVPGQDAFGGWVLHAAAYKNPQPFEGKRTLVVGCGNSGAEIALDLAEKGVDVAMVVRGPVHVVPRDLLGRPTQHTNVLLSHLPVGLRDAIARFTVDLVVGDLSRWGIVRPAQGPNRMIEESGRFPLLDIGTIAMVKRGKIRVLPAVEKMVPGGVGFVDGTQHPFDAIIFATGYTPALGAVVEGFEAIADQRGRPHRFGEETAIAGLYFVGFKNPPTGALREIAREAPKVAQAIRARTFAQA